VGVLEEGLGVGVDLGGVARDELAELRRENGIFQVPVQDLLARLGSL